MTTLSMFNLSNLKAYSNSIRMTAITTNSHYISSDTMSRCLYFYCLRMQYLGAFKKKSGFIKVIQMHFLYYFSQKLSVLLVLNHCKD